MQFLGNELFDKTEPRPWLRPSGPERSKGSSFSIGVLIFILLTILSLVFSIFGQVAGANILSLAGFSDLFGSGPRVLALVLFGLFLPSAIITMVWVRYAEKLPFTSMGFSKTAGLKTFARGHVIGIGTISIIVAAIWMSGGYEVGAILPALSSPAGLFSIFLLLLGFAVQSSVEEIIFRGWMLGTVTRRFNLLTGIIISSLIFTLLHFDGDNHWITSVNIMLFAVFAALWTIKTGNIWGVMGWHAGWNWMQSVGYELPVTGIEVGTPALVVELTDQGALLLTGGNIGPEGSYFCTALFVVAIVYLARHANAPAIEARADS